MTKYLILVSALLLITSIGRASSLGLPTAFDNDSIAIVTGINPTPLAGDTVHLLLHFRANVTGFSILTVKFPGNVAPPDQRIGETERDSVIHVDSGSSYTYLFPLKLFQYGASMIRPFIRTSVPLDNIENQSCFLALAIEHTSGSFVVLGDGLHSRNDTCSVIMGSSSGAHVASCVLSGKVRYHDDEDAGYPIKGVYGAYVICLFHPKGITGGAGTACQIGPDKVINTNFAHPVPGWIDGTHYAKIAEDGSFEFNFYTSFSDWSSYWDVELLVSTWNDAAAIEHTHTDDLLSSYTISGSDYPLNDPAWPITPQITFPPTTPVNDFTTFRQSIYLVPSNACITCPGPGVAAIHQTDIELEIDNRFGAHLRNLELSQEFDQVRFSESIPRIVSVAYGTATDPSTGTFTPAVPAISLNYSRHGWRPTTTDHEWGHWYDDQIGTMFTNGDFDNNSESFAEFHQFAVRCYANTKYGDAYDWKVLNLEEEWTIRTRVHKPPPQSDIIVWQNGGGYNQNPIVGFSCFLWQIYDKYNAWNYERAEYDGDNDDIDDPYLLDFFVKSGPNIYESQAAYRADLLDALKVAAANHSPIDYVGEPSSIQKIYECMLPTPDNEVYPPFPSAQVKSIGGSIESHEAGLYCSFSWDYQNLTSVLVTVPNPKNLPTGVRIYQADGYGGWVQREDVAYPATSASFGSNSFESQFKVTAYNAAGESCRPIELDLSSKIATDGFEQANVGRPFIVAYPNPSSGPLSFEISHLSENIPVLVEFLDATGAEVSRLYDGCPNKAGTLQLSYDGSRLASGSYYLRVTKAGLSTEAKVSIVK